MAACQGGATANAQPDIVIASAFPTSAFGDPRLFEQAIDFAVRQQGSIDGYTLGYRAFDDSLGSDQNQLVARRNVRHMIADSSVLGVIGPATSLITAVDLPASNAALLAMVSPSATNVCLTQTQFYCRPTPAELRPSGTTTFFRISPRDPLQGEAIAGYAVDRLGVRRVAAFNEVGPEGTLYINALSDELRKRGAELVYQQDFPHGIDKFSDFLSSAKEKGATAIYAVAESDACIAAAQMSALMPGAILLGTDGIAVDDNCIKTMGASPPQTWATLTAVDRIVSADSAVTKRAESFLKAFPRPSAVSALSPFRLAAYDCARILIEAIKIAIDANGGHLPTRPQVVAALAANRFVESTGTYSFESSGDAVVPMMSVYKVQDSHWVFADVYSFGSP